MKLLLVSVIPTIERLVHYFKECTEVVKYEHRTAERGEAQEYSVFEVSWLQADSEPNTWNGSWQRTAGNILEIVITRLEDDLGVRIQEACFITYITIILMVWFVPAKCLFPVLRWKWYPQRLMWTQLKSSTVVGKGSKVRRGGMLTDTNKQVVLGWSQRVGSKSTVGVWGWLASWLLS